MVKVGIIDSGVNPAHPHVGGVAGGVSITAGGDTPVYLDYLGHGTAVAGAIREKAPQAQIFAVKVFDHALKTSIGRILRAIEWCLDNQLDIINLSLGTHNPAHRSRFEPLIARAVDAGVVLVSARDSLPGALPGVFAVGLDRDCPRDAYRYAHSCFLASGYPRPIPGVPPQRNLHGISFAVANMTGFVARAKQQHPGASLAELRQLLVEHAVPALPARHASGGRES